jgi:hypothetical protein
VVVGQGACVAGVGLPPGLQDSDQAQGEHN